MLNQIWTWGTWIVPPLCLPIQRWSTLCRSHQRSESRKYNADENLWSLPEVCGCLSRRRWHGLCCWRRCSAGAQADRACCPSSRTWPQKCRRFGKPGQKKDDHPCVKDKEWLKIEMRQWGTKRPGSCGFLCRRRRWIPMNRCRCPRDSWTSHCHFPGSDCLRCGNWKQLDALNKDQKPQLLPDFQKSSGSDHWGQRSESDGCT